MSIRNNHRLFKKLIYYSFIVLVFNFKTTNAQLQTSNWYFGKNAGLTFNNNPPSALLNGALSTDEGCATISDKNGNLLFYTDGIFVYDRTHTRMPNGFGLMGDPSSAQSGIIVPKPGFYNQYYIFTVAAEGTPNGFRYSEVNLNLNNGMGDVVTSTKNTLLFAPSVEKIAAVQHSNGLYTWVIAHGLFNNRFYAYLIDCQGIKPPVTSDVGLPEGTPGWGGMAISSDGKKIAKAARENGFELFDFNTTTGILSNPILLGRAIGAYGISFSPNNNLLYGCVIEGGQIFQWNLNSGTSTDIINSQIQIGTGQGVGVGYRGGAIQQGLDGKLYIPHFLQPYLSTINNPDVIGLGCNLQHFAVNLQGRNAVLGLPPFIQSYLSNTSSITYTNQCQTYNFTISSASNIDSVKWNFGDPNSGSNNVSSIFNPSHVYTSNGQYTVTLIRYLNCFKDTTQTNITVSNSTNAPSFTQIPNICSGENITLPSTSNNGINGTWSPAIDNTKTTTYIFTPSTGQCTTTMTVTVNQPVNPAFSQITAICRGGSITLPTTSNNNITGTWFPAINNTATTTYTFTPSAGQCANTAQMTVTVKPIVNPAFTQVSPICSGENFTLPTTSNNGITGTWSPAINNTATTTYTFTPDAGQCANTVQMTVTVNQPVIPAFTQVAAICSGGSFTLPTTSNNGITGSWLPAINNTTTTTYTFTPDAGQCATTSQMTVTVNQPVTPVFTQVAAICNGGSFTLPTTSNNNITGSWLPAINNAATTTYTFTPTAGQCASSSQMTVTVNAAPTLVLTAGNNAQSICEGRPITNITYTFGGSATSASVSGLPAGLTATVSGNSITISGTPAGATFAAIPYMVTTGGGNCGTATAGGTITVNPLPVISAGPDRKVELGKTVVLNGTASGSSNNILWTPPSGLSSTNTLTPVATITQTTTYTLAVTSQFGCTSTDQVLVTLLLPVDVPNVFSPNGDGIHDRWIIRNLEMYDNVRVQIFNRYGSMLFERFAYNSSNAWDGNLNGNPAPVGPYYYVITYGEGKRLAGVVSIIR